jgi:hypothetical protein
MHVGVAEGGEPNESFAYYVRYLGDNVLPPKNRSWLDRIRLRGNEETHEIVLASKEDAEEMLKLVNLLLTVTYATKGYH